MVFVSSHINQQKATSLVAFVFLVLLMLTAPILSAAQKYDGLELAAVQSPLAAKSLVYSVSRTGDRFFAAGQRGHILYSDDYGETWTQAEVPVRTAILDIHFPTQDMGWAVGHSGVILHSIDGGKTWIKQFDGYRLGSEGLAYYQSKADAEPENERFSYLVGEMQYAVQQGADKPFFKVHFEDINTGFVVGAYGVLFRTDDGGKNWVPYMEILDLYQYIHLFDFDIVDGNYVLAGEMGTLLLRDEESGDFIPQDYPFDGSIYTVLTIGPDQLIAGGLRGKVFHSADAGKSWSESVKPGSGAVVDSLLLSDGRILIVSDEGKLMVSADSGETFSILKTSHRGRISSVIESSPGKLIVSGPFGLHRLSLNN